MDTGLLFSAQSEDDSEVLLVGTQAVLCTAVAKCKSLFCESCVTC